MFAERDPDVARPMSVLSTRGTDRVQKASAARGLRPHLVGVHARLGGRHGGDGGRLPAGPGGVTMYTSPSTAGRGTAFVGWWRAASLQLESAPAA